MKKNWLNGIIVFLITIAVLFFILKDNFSSTLNILSKINIPLFILGIILYIAVFSLEGIVSMKLIKEYKKSFSFKDSFSLSLILRFFNGITPFSTGGRPLQVYELKKRGVRVVDGTNVIVQNFIIFQFSLIIFTTVTLLLNSILKIYPAEGFLYSMTIIGFILNAVLLFFALLFSISKNLNKHIIKFFIKIFSKLKLIKNKEEQIKKWEDYCMDFYNAFNDFKYKKKLILSSIGIQLIALITFYSVVICVFYSLGLKVTNPLAMIIGSNFIFVTGCYVPIPGGSGGIEYAFLNYFSKFAIGPSLSSALIIWRFITYYLPTLAGGIAFNIKKRKLD